MIMEEVDRELWHPVWHLYPRHCEAFQRVDVELDEIIEKRGNAYC